MAPPNYCIDRKNRDDARGRDKDVAGCPKQ